MKVILKKTIGTKINEAIASVADKSTIDHIELTKEEIAELAKGYPTAYSLLTGNVYERAANWFSPEGARVVLKPAVVGGTN